MKSASLSVIVPVYNEAKAIEQTIRQFEQIQTDISFPFEVIFVNDGSNDGAEIVLKKLSNPQFKVVHHTSNRGYGAAIKTGIKASSYDFVGITDADSTYPNDLIPDFFHEILEGSYDMIVGARTGHTAKIPLIRKPAKWFLTKLADYLTNTRIPDLNSGFRIMKKEAVQRFLHILPDGFSFTTTITLAMLTDNYSVKYRTIDYHVRKGKSKIRPLYDTFNFIQIIFRTILYFNPLKIFFPMSVFSMGLGAILILYRAFVERRFATTAVVLLMGGLQLLALGLVSDLINKRSISTNSTQ